MRMGAAFLGFIVLTATTAHAQTTAATTPLPETMPFDIPYGTPINLDQAHKAIIAAANEASKHNWKMAISVVDQAGNLVTHATMDGTQYAPVEISQAKARTAALYRRAMGIFQAAVNTGGFPSTLSLMALTHGAAIEGVFPSSWTAS